MNTTEFAKSNGINYQTANRIVRKLLAQDGKKAVTGQHFEFTPEFEQRVKDGLAALKAGKAKKPQPIQSTMEQRREWREVWSPAFMASIDRQAWVDFAFVLASIDHSRFPGWLSKPTAKGDRIGDVALLMAHDAGADSQPSGDVTGFTRWLLDNGFKAFG